MKYINIKRYKFSTITRSVSSFTKSILNLLKLANFKKIYNYIYDIKYNLKNFSKKLHPRNYNLTIFIKKIRIKKNNFISLHIPIFIIFFGFLYFAIPIFYNYDKSNITKAICKNKNIDCEIQGKVSYRFFPTPKIKLEKFIINIPLTNTTLLTSEEVLLKLSVKNLLAKDKHKVKNIVIKDFESNINLKKIKNYNSVFKNKISSIPIIFNEGKISFYDDKNYIASISKVNLTAKILQDYSKIKLEGKFLNDKIIINYSNKIKDNKPETNIDLRMKNTNFLTKISFFNSIKNIKNGKFLVKQVKNNISGIFDYSDSKITIVKSNVRNSFIDGKLIGKIIFLPYFDFDLDLNLNNINFTKLYNYFLSLHKDEQKKIFKINNKINGKLGLSADRVYSKYNLVKSFESRLKFYNQNIKIEQLLVNFGKLGAADLLGKIESDDKSSNFKFESNIFIDNKKKFLSKFGIYNKQNISPNMFIQGNFDLQNIRASFYEISGKEKFKEEDINFIETEFNDFILANGFEDLFDFQKFKVFLKYARDDNN